MRCQSLHLFLVLLLFTSGCREAPGPGAAETPLVPTAAPITWDQPDWVAEAVIYELFVPDFTEAGTFQAIIPRLPELKALGVNTLWLMPIHPIGEAGRKGTLGSPYAIRDYYAVNPAFGTAEDFRALVEAVHAQDMHLIIDFVANHTAPDHPWVEEHPGWYTRDEAGNVITPRSPEGDPTDWTDVVDLDYENAGLRAEMVDVMRYWIEEFDIDGYRCDVAGWVPDVFWEEAITSIREIKPVLMLAEDADINFHQIGFDLTYAWPEYHTLKQVWNGAPVSSLVGLVQRMQVDLPDGAGRLRFTTNHDETAWDAPPPALFGGTQGAEAAFVLTASLPGVPLLYNGQETGVAEPVPFFEQTPYDWSQNPEVHAFFDRYLDLYNRSEALREGTLTFLTPQAEDMLLFERATEGERLFVAVNVRNRPVTMSWPRALRNAVLVDALTQESVAEAETLELPAYGYRLLQVQ